VTNDSGSNGRAVRRVCVYCASSSSSDPEYRTAARTLGETLAANGVTVVYGGGATGSMGALADGALARGGKVVGVIPHFMCDMEWAHKGLSELIRVEDMHARKRLMIDGVDGVVALPGGSGTFEELFEAISLKRLGIYTNPIVLVNTREFFDQCTKLLDLCVEERFMDRRHLEMWTLVDRPEDALEAIRRAVPWDPSARRFAVI